MSESRRADRVPNEGIDENKPLAVPNCLLTELPIHRRRRFQQGISKTSEPPSPRHLLHDTTAKPAKPAKRQKTSNGSSKADVAPTHSHAAEKRKVRAAELERVRQELPIWKGKDRVVEAVETHRAVIILGETGCGKTTQVPQFLRAQYSLCKDPCIVVTQPRRVAAISLAARVAEEQGCTLGGTVGYTVRFDDCSSDATRLKYVTDGTLLQEMLSDRMLSNYDIVIVDEAHERTLRTDMILGFIKAIQRERNAVGAHSQSTSDGQSRQLKIVIMSATIDAERFSDFFDKAPILYVKGRQFPVHVKYAKSPQSDYLDAALKSVFQIAKDHPPGDILVFLTGEDEIESLASQIDQYAPSLVAHDPKLDKIQVNKLYAKLPPHIQAEAFKPASPRIRKVILATNIAETSVTIPGVRFVVDTGMMKEKNHHATAAVDTLLARPISQSSAQQRMGRAGRQRDGLCFRLYPEAAYLEMDRTQQPEILRCNLEYAVLHLKAAGQQDVLAFDFMDRPENSVLAQAMLQLVALGAMTVQGDLTDDGRVMAGFPLTPSASRILLTSFTLGCPKEVTSLLAILDHADKLLSIPAPARDSVAEARAPYVHRDGDHLTLLRLLNAYEHQKHSLGEAAADRWLREVHIAKRTMRNILHARKQVRERCERQKLEWNVSAGDEDSMAENVLRCCASGLGMNSALLREDGKYRSTSSSMEVKIHPSSVLAGRRAPVILYSELIFTTAIYARVVGSIRPEWLQEHCAGIYGRRTI